MIVGFIFSALVGYFIFNVILISFNTYFIYYLLQYIGYIALWIFGAIKTNDIIDKCRK